MKLFQLVDIWDVREDLSVWDMNRSVIFKYLDWIKVGPYLEALSTFAWAHDTHLSMITN